MPLDPSANLAMKPVARGELQLARHYSRTGMSGRSARFNVSFQFKFQVRCAAAKQAPHVRWGFKLKRTGVGYRHDVAGAGCLLEMQLRSTIVDLPEHLRDAFFDLGMVRAVARDKLLNDCPQCFGRQLLMRNTYGRVPWSANDRGGAAELGHPSLRHFPSRQARRVLHRPSQRSSSAYVTSTFFPSQLALS
jgi:hypothetical protein